MQSISTYDVPFVEAYLERIGHAGPVHSDLTTLRALHRQHMLTVPFENLDIHAHVPIVLDLHRICEKVVTRRRGGFCYELNGLFASLLRELKFDVKMISARVAEPTGGFSPEFDHMALLVQVDGRPWLADVGFGAAPLEPLALESATEQVHEGIAYHFRNEGDLWTLNTAEDGFRKPVYRFSIAPRRLEDFAEMCNFHQTSPLSHFTQKRICSKATPDGRITLSDWRLIVTRGPERTEQTFETEAEVDDALRKFFGVEL